jgi:DNA-binding IscR family transcriptional regulator
MWDKVQKAVSDVYDKTTFEDLVDQQRQKMQEVAPCYSI